MPDNLDPNDFPSGGNGDPSPVTDTTPPDSTSTYTPPNDPLAVTGPAGTDPYVDPNDLTYEDVLIYNTTTGAIVMGFSGHKYQNDQIATPSGCARLIGHKATSENGMVLVGGTPTFTAIPKITDASSWNQTVVSELSDTSVGYNPNVIDRFNLVSGVTATLGAYLPTNISVFLRAPQATGYPVDWYDFTTTAGSWSFSVNAGFEGDYNLIIRAAGYQDYYVHILVTAS